MIAGASALSAPDDHQAREYLVMRSAPSAADQACKSGWAYLGRMVAIARASAIAVVALVMALTGCSPNSPTGGVSGGNCVPRVHIEPAIVHPGGPITVVSTDKCNVKVPTGGWNVVAGHIGDGKALVREKSSGTFDGSFRAQLTLPGDFPLGDAYAGIKNWDYSTCADSGSCASPQGVFKVQP
jgi:hypothetical protein